jgi:trans-2,3-dihydro-3-hydroxyanthranilate isomerase
MNRHILYIVDVFAEEKYAGNQLAVIRDAGDLACTEMQRIAKEMNYSETTFITSDEERNGGYNVRIFTPQEEVPFAGHPTLGTAYVIQREIVGEEIEKVVLNLKVGHIPVTFIYQQGQPDVLWMQQRGPTYGPTFMPEMVSRVLGIGTQEIDGRFPVQEVSTGLPFIIVPVKSLEAIKSCTIDRDRYYDLVNDTQAKAILVFCPETYNSSNDLNVRVFADYYGVPEDPATGSANGCLAAYLVRNRYFGKEQIDIRVEQGYEIGRPSLLFLRAEDRSESVDVFVGGQVIMVAKGEMI